MSVSKGGIKILYKNNNKKNSKDDAPFSYLKIIQRCERWPVDNDDIQIFVTNPSSNDQLSPIGREIDFSHKS